MKPRKATVVPSTDLANAVHRGVVRFLRRAASVEEAAGKIYDILAARFTDDALLHQFWSNMAADERKHGKKLGTWRQLLKPGPTTEQPDLADFGKAMGDLERLTRDLAARAAVAATPDDAFAIALALESGELDIIYTTLLQSSPIARFPDVAETRRAEIGRHHEALLEMVRARSQSEHNRTMAALIAAEE
jgi:rubrerythrin